MFNDLKSIIAIPARLESSRLPNKLIADINGKPLIRRVIERCKKVKNCSQIFLCTDSQKIAEIGENLNVKTIITSKEISSGSERIYSVLDKIIQNIYDINISEINSEIKEKILKSLLIVNVQGDQPFIEKKVIEEMIDFFNNNKGKNQVITPTYKLKKDAIFNPNVVKLVLNHLNQVIYFSRSPIPYLRGIENNEWHKKFNFWGHVGIYGYRGDILFNWNNYRKSNLEDVECLEQLRLIQEGVVFDTFKVEGDFLSVDTKLQLLEAIKIAKGKSL